MVFEWIFRQRDYWKISAREQKEILILSTIYGFIITFRMWGSDSFDPVIGVLSWVFGIILFFITILWNVGWQKFAALIDGNIMHFHWWIQGSLFGLFFAFVSYGFFPLTPAGNAYFEHDKRLRLGRFRYGSNIKDFALSSVWGISANIILACVLAMIYMKFSNPWLLIFIKINLLYAFYAMLPIPRLQAYKLGEGGTPGLHIFFFGRPLWAFLFTTLLVYSAVIIAAATIWNSFIILILSLIAGLLFMWLFMHVVENAR